MKKSFWNRMISMLLVMACVFSLAACGDGEITGTYKLQTMEVAGMTLNWEQLVAAYAKGKEEDFAINLVVNADGTLKLDMDAIDSESSLEGTWEGSGSTIKITVEGVTSECTVKDGVITITEGEAVMTFKK